MISRYASVCSVLGLTAAPVVLAVPADVSPVEAAEGVVERVTPSAKGAVSFKLNPALQNRITISGIPGSIRVEASDVRHLIGPFCSGSLVSDSALLKVAGEPRKGSWRTFQRG